MAASADPSAPVAGSARETYTHGHHESVLRSHRARTVENSAAHVVSYLRPGVRLLDVGCGPGTITVDFAARVAPGEVIGIDAAPDVLELARAEAVASGRDNVRFDTGDVYALAFGDHDFDVVHAHQLLQHLGDPVAALVEMRRVCRPDGVIALREADYRGFSWYPEPPELDEWMHLFQTVTRANGGEPAAGRRVLHWARAAGCSDVRPGASVWCFATHDERAWWAGSWADRTVGSAFGARAVELGLATRDDLERIATAWRAWAAQDDAWFAVLHGEVLAAP